MRIAALSLVVLLAAQARAQERPPYVDEKTWNEAKARCTKGALERCVQALELSRRQSWGRSLQELERERLGFTAFDADSGQRLVAAPLASPEITALHAAGFAAATAPRLTGHIVRIGGEGEAPTLRLASQRIVAGDTVLVPAGKDILDLGFRAPRRAPAVYPVADVAIVGSGAGKTVLTVFARRGLPVQRLRVESCTLDFLARPVSISGSTVHLRRCRITNFRGPAFQGDDVVLFLEDCVFVGRDNAEDHAFDLGGESLVFARRTRFEALGSLSRATPAFPVTVDGCSTDGWKDDQCTEKGAVFARKSAGIFSEATGVREIEHATDDDEAIAFAAGERAAPDEVSARVAAILDLERSVPYWIALLADERPHVRALAGRMLEKLTGDRPATGAPEEPAPEGIAALVAALDADEWPLREEASRRLEVAGERARPALLAAARSGSAEQRERARALLATLAARALVGNEPERARLARWFEGARERLVWDEEKRRFIEKDFK